MISLWIWKLTLLFLIFIQVTVNSSLEVRSTKIQKEVFSVSRNLLNVEASVGAITPSEYNALYDFYEATDGKNWHWYNTTPPTNPWTFDVYNLNAPCSDDWQGITCSCSLGECVVSQLSLERHNISGVIPSSIGNLNSLTFILLDDNRLNGTIPESVGNFTDLRVFSIARNRLVGLIPDSLGLATGIYEIVLARNNMTGSIPESLYQLRNLSILELDFNSFGGTLSPSIGNLTRMQFFKLEHNFFHGKLPKTIGYLQNLSHFIISINQFSKTLPEEIYSLTKMQIFDISENHFTGTISPSVGNWSNLQTWFSYRNGLFGKLPLSFFNPMMPMHSLDIEGNFISGPLPIEIMNWKDSLQTLFLSTNCFTGTIPSNLSDFQILYSAQLDSNFFHGQVETLFQNISSMVYLDFGFNSFTGKLPNSNHWPFLFYYIVNINYFTGQIPIGPLTVSNSLYYLDLAYNYLTGSIPKVFNANHDFLLNYANFSNNFLTGNLNNTFGNVPTLVSLALSNNKLTGTIPWNFGNIDALLYLFLNNNELTGTVPHSLKNLRNLKVLFLQQNKLTGTIQTMVNWNSLENADVSNNQLSGTLPYFVAENPSIKTFAASSNCFSGSIPSLFCNLSSVEVLSLDGLSTATSCRKYLFPGSSLLTAFSLESIFFGSIPDCLYQMPNLQTLHLSGNALTGSLPSNIIISDSLIDLTLSHNILTGSIPANFQKRYWSNFDISYNKITGTLSNSYHSFNNDSSSLSLEVNRLSGSIPSSLVNAINIDLVEGNMFSCNYDRDDLPKHDSKTKSYSCGSEVVNAAFYTWLVIISIVILLSVLIYFLQFYFCYFCNFQSFFKFISEIILWRKTFLLFCEQSQNRANALIQRIEQQQQYGMDGHAISSSPFNPIPPVLPVQATPIDLETHLASVEKDRPPHLLSVDSATNNNNNNNISTSNRINSNNTNNPILINQLPAATRSISTGLSGSTVMEYGRIYKLFIFFKKLRSLFLILTILIVFIAMPVYGITSNYYHEFYYKYIWTISALLLTGANAGIIIQIFFFFITFALIILYKLLISPYKSNNNSDLFTNNNNNKSADNSSVNSGGNQSKNNNSNKSRSRTRSLIENANSLFSKSSYFRESILKEETNYLSSLSLLIVGFFNCMLMICADILYVWIILNYDTTIIVLAEIFLAIFKIFLNNTLLWEAIPYVRDWLDHGHTSRNSIISISSLTAEEVSSLKNIQLYQYTINDLSFLSVTILLNNIIFPAIAILIVSPDCFYNALFAADSVSSSYTYNLCIRYAVFGAQDCLDSVTDTIVSSYSPPYLYSYQCASVIVINYAAVFILMFTFEGVIQPVFKLIVKYIYDRYYEEHADLTISRDVSIAETGGAHTDRTPSFMQENTLIMQDQYKRSLQKTIQPIIPLTSTTTLSSRDDPQQIEESLVLSESFKKSTLIGDRPTSTSNVRFSLTPPAPLLSSSEPLQSLERIQENSKEHAVSSDNSQQTNNTTGTNTSIQPHPSSSSSSASIAPEQLLRQVPARSSLRVTNTTDFRPSLVNQPPPGGADPRFSATKYPIDGIAAPHPERDTIVTNRRTVLAVTIKPNHVIPWYFKTLFRFLPYNLTHLIAEPSFEIRRALLLFDKNRIIVRLTAYLVVFMSFGVLFPPLAVITCLTAFSLTYYEEMMIGRILYECEKMNYPWYKKQIDRNCSGISNSLKYSLWTLVPVSGLLFSYLIFDTYGDEIGWKSSFLPTFIMFFIPILLLFVYSKRRWVSDGIGKCQGWFAPVYKADHGRSPVSTDSSSIPSVILNILHREKKSSQQNSMDRKKSKSTSSNNPQRILSIGGSSLSTPPSMEDEHHKKVKNSVPFRTRSKSKSSRSTMTNSRKKRNSQTKEEEYDEELSKHSDTISAFTVSHYSTSTRQTSLGSGLDANRRRSSRKGGGGTSIGFSESEEGDGDEEEEETDENEDVEQPNENESDYYPESEHSSGAF